MPKIYINKRGTISQAQEILINQNDNWKPVREVYVNNSGTWVKAYPESGSTAFATAGTYNFTVPAGIYNMTIAVVGGGGGGGNTLGGAVTSAGGGGGSGGVYLGNFNTVPGETITVTVGAGGAASRSGLSSTVAGSLTTITATGGGAGNDGRYDADGDNDFDEGGEFPGGAPGEGGFPNGVRGTPGSTTPGHGGNNGFVPGVGIASTTRSGADTAIYNGTYPVYNGFLNSYGVWTSTDFVSPVGAWVRVNYTVTIPHSKTYRLVCSADNHIRVYYNGATIGANDDWGSSNAYDVHFDAGQVVITCEALNDGGPALFAAALYDGGDVIWNTRSPLIDQAPAGAVYGLGGDGGMYDPDGDNDWDEGGETPAGHPGTGGYVSLSW